MKKLTIKIGFVLALAMAMLLGSAVPANAYYVTTAGCKTGYSKTWQVAWWDPMGAFGTWRGVCYKKGESVPLWY